MTAKERKKYLVLFLLLALLCLSIYSANQRNGQPSGTRILPAAAQPKEAPVQTVAQKDELPSLPLLNHRSPVFTDSRRNIFEFGDEEVDPASGGDTKPGSDPQTPQTEAPASATRITFVGIYIEKDDPASRTAVLNVSGKIVVVEKGDSLAGGYRVARIDDKSVTITGSGLDQALRLMLGQSSSLPD